MSHSSKLSPVNIYVIFWESSKEIFVAKIITDGWIYWKTNFEVDQEFLQSSKYT